MARTNDCQGCRWFRAPGAYDGPCAGCYGGEDFTYDSGCAVGADDDHRDITWAMTQVERLEKRYGPNWLVERDTKRRP